MKNTRLQKYLLGAFATLALASSVSMAQPTNFLIEPTGTNVMSVGGGGNQTSSTDANGDWQNWYVSPVSGAVAYNIVFDTNNPPPNPPPGFGSPSIGSMEQTQNWTNATAAAIMTYATVDGNFWGNAVTFDATMYSNVVLDFKYDTNSTITPTNAAQFEVHVGDNLRTTSDGVTLQVFANSGASASNFDGTWHRLNVPIPATVANVNLSKGIGFKTFEGTNVAGTFNYWIANIELQARPVTLPPPTLSFQPTVNGLNLWNDKAPNYTRHQVRTDTAGDFNVNWVGHTPVTYTWNYAHAPTNNGAGVNFAITPDPVTGTTGAAADPDWSSTNCFYLLINEVGGTSVVATVTLKTNQPSQNSTAVSIVRLTNNTPTAAGTWSLTFTNDTGFVLTAPGGASTNATIPANFLTDTNGQLNIYSNQVSIFLSATPNNDNNYGSYADVTTFDVTGVATPIHENFVTQAGIVSPFLLLQDQTYGFVPPNVAPNMLFVTSNDWNWLTWSLPDAQFTPVIRTNLGSGIWLDSPLTNINLFGSTRYTKISEAYQAASTQQYFGLVKRAFSQLQVILPGETNAPGTPTGKIGTPTPVSLNDPNTFGVITFTVNACDATWHIIPGVFDTVSISSTNDPTGTAPTPAALANGTGTFQWGFDMQGAFTVIASDVTHTNILSNESSPVTVGP